MNYKNLFEQILVSLCENDNFSRYTTINFVGKGSIVCLRADDAPFTHDMKSITAGKLEEVKEVAK